MNRQVIDIAGIPVGVLIPVEGRLRFMAVKYQVFALDGRIYSSVSDARSAISGHVHHKLGH